MTAQRDEVHGNWIQPDDSIEVGSIIKGGF